MPVFIPEADLKRRAIRATEWKQFRMRHLLSQTDLAQAAGISRRTICAIEAGEVTYPSFEVLRKFRDLKQRCARAERADPIPNTGRWQ